MYMLWDDTAIAALDMRNRALFDREPSYHGKADIARLEILIAHGGAYIDADSVVTKPAQLDSLLRSFDAEVGFGWENSWLIANGTILACAGSPFLAACRDEMPLRNAALMPWQKYGPQLVTDLYHRHKASLDITLYEPTVFYPIKWHGIRDVELHKKIELPPQSCMFQYGYSTNSLEAQVAAASEAAASAPAQI